MPFKASIFASCAPAPSESLASPAPQIPYFCHHRHQMHFNSFDFAVFLPVVFLLYWFLVNRNLGWQNALIVIASYVFYGWWDHRFLALIAFSTVVDYTIALLMDAGTERRRKCLLWLSVIVNLGLLGVFKYYNFFLESFVDAFALFGKHINTNTLNVILPVGISFYTFQTLSYSIDVYRRRLKPCRDFIAYSAYVCFFPQLVAGPIERASHLLPQFLATRRFDYSRAVDGLRQILWGLFKKMVIADNCARYATEAFDNHEAMTGSSLALGSLAFAFQIYGDFSGYSDIAIGTARLFGFDLKRNFAFPYFSRDIAEFWRRWHISLSTWFRDYLYIPLGGSRGPKWMQVRNVFIIFLVSGFWHGANWTFIIWGGLHALFFLPLLLLGRNRNHLEIVANGKTFPTLRELLSMLLTFSLVTLAWVFFRAESVGQATAIIGEIFSPTLFKESKLIPESLSIIVGVFLLVEWSGRQGAYGIARTGLSWPKTLRWVFYLLIVSTIVLYSGEEKEFIYFQF